MTTALILFSLLAVAFAVGPVVNPAVPNLPIIPFPPARPCPPTCDNVYCPSGYHCVLQQHTVCVRAPCNFPKYPTCVRNILTPIG